jgi:transposase-like protein
MTSKETNIHTRVQGRGDWFGGDGEKSSSAVARDLGLIESALRRWVLQSETEAGRGEAKALTTPERAEWVQLRRENR